MSWRYIAASVLGTSHFEQNVNCQDASIASDVGGGVVLLAASDGAGSARLSDVGSKLACYTLLEQVTAFVAGGCRVADVTENTVNVWLDALSHRLRLQADAVDAPVRELACTLVAAILDDTASAYIQLGDGGIVAREGDEYTAVTWPAGGDYANTTYFLTDDHGLQRLQVQLGREPTPEAAVFTDGLQMLVLQFDTRRAHAPFFVPLFARLRQEQAGESLDLTRALEDYLASPAINKRTDDDKTLVLAARMPLSLGTADQSPSGSAPQ